jgi:palmitoyltransferase ZDHHC9/14/18
MQRFFCFGYLVGGPNWRASLGTAALIAAPAGVYIAFVGIYLAENVNPALLVFG